MVIANLENLSLIAPENDGRDLDRKKSRQVKGGFDFFENRNAVAKANIQGDAVGSLLAFVGGTAFTFVFIPFNNH